MLVSLLAEKLREKARQSRVQSKQIEMPFGIFFVFKFRKFYQKRRRVAARKHGSRNRNLQSERLQKHTDVTNQKWPCVCEKRITTGPL